MQGDDIIQAPAQGDAGPLTNRAQVGTFLYPEDYSPPPLRYWNPVHNPQERYTASVDMVRLTIDLDRDEHATIEDTAQRFCSFLDKYTADYVETWDSRKAGSYQRLYALSWGCLKPAPTKERPERKKVDKTLPTYGAVKVGLGLHCGKDKPKWSAGFVEFNPAKVGHFAAPFLLALLGQFRCTLSLARWDFAVDIPLPRKSVRTHKDARKYECVISSGITEYLGQRDNPGRVKVYDKSAESKLDKPWTRIELTCSGDWQQPSAAAAFPRVYRCAAPGEDATPTARALVASLADLADHGFDVGVPLAMLEPRTRRTIESMLEVAAVRFPAAAWDVCAALAGSWCLPLTIAATTGI